MPYTAHHLYSRSDHPVVQNAAATHILWAQSDADAIHEADVWLRSSRVVARVTGDEQPVCELVLRDGHEVGRVTL
jgi:hypothetical protein